MISFERVFLRGIFFIVRSINIRLQALLDLRGLVQFQSPACLGPKDQLLSAFLRSQEFTLNHYRLVRRLLVCSALTSDKTATIPINHQNTSMTDSSPKL